MQKKAMEVVKEPTLAEKLAALHVDVRSRVAKEGMQHPPDRYRVKVPAGFDPSTM